MPRAHRADCERPAEVVAAASAASALSVAGVTPSATNLRHFHPASASFDHLPQGEFSVVRKVTSGIHGDVFAYRWQRPCIEHRSRCVAVKKLRPEAVAAPAGDIERDERRSHLKIGGLRKPFEEDALAEIGIMQRLAKNDDLPLYVLRLLGVFQDNGHVWLVTEFAEGGELFGEIQASGPIAEARAMRWCWEILQAVSYLHRHGVGHRDISLENILLKDGGVRVMDFGMAVQSRTFCGTPLRYFRKVGKPAYRAPECYVPHAEFVDVVVPAGAEAGTLVSAAVNREYYCEVLLPPGAKPQHCSRAQVSGYTVPPADVFAVGACMFIMLTGNPPWREATLEDQYFCYARVHGLLALRSSWGLPAMTPAAAEALLGMTAAEPARRLSAEQCLALSWFQEFAGAAVPTHAEEDCRRATALSMAGA